MNSVQDFQIGERVEVRDNNDWREGFIAKILGLKILVQCDGWSPMEFKHIRKLASKSPLQARPIYKPQQKSLTKNNLKVPKMEDFVMPMDLKKKRPHQQQKKLKKIEPKAKMNQITVLVRNPPQPTYITPPVMYRVDYYPAYQYVNPMWNIQNYQMYANNYQYANFYPPQVNQAMPEVPQPPPVVETPQTAAPPSEPVAEKQLTAIPSILGETNFELPTWVKPIISNSGMAQ